MPIYRDESHPDCKIRCDNDGFAKYQFPPGRCVRMCGAKSLYKAVQISLESDGLHGKFYIDIASSQKGFVFLARNIDTLDTSHPEIGVEGYTSQIKKLAFSGSGRAGYIRPADPYFRDGLRYPDGTRKLSPSGARRWLKEKRDRQAAFEEPSLRFSGKTTTAELLTMAIKAADDSNAIGGAY